MFDWINLQGLIPYEDGIALMERKLTKVIDKEENQSIFLLEHDHVYTAGTSYQQSELTGNYLDIPVIYTGRGGKFTYHGPGQRVIYPIIDLRGETGKHDIKLYVRNLESWIIATLKHFQIDAYTIDGMVGIWTKKNGMPAKIGAIGIRVKKWVTYHGIAVNISNDLNMYKGIIPCGISEFPVTSINELGIKITVEDFDLALKKEFGKIFK